MHAAIVHTVALQSSERFYIVLFTMHCTLQSLMCSAYSACAMRERNYKRSDDCAGAAVSGASLPSELM